MIGFSGINLYSLVVDGIAKYHSLYNILSLTVPKLLRVIYRVSLHANLVSQGIPDAITKI